MAKKDLPKSHIVVATDADQPVDRLRISTIVRRNGRFRRATIRYRKRADAYPIRMPPGRHPFLVSATEFLDAHGAVLFEKGVLHTQVFTLELKTKPRFRPLNELPKKVVGVFERSAVKARAESAETYYEKLGPVSKAAALNILAKMAKTPVIQRRKVIDYVDHVYKVRPDRLYARLTDGRSLFTDIVDSRQRRKPSIFSPASSALHKGFEAASFKTREEDLMGNLQLSLSSLGHSGVKVDADIDIYADVLFHLFGEVFWNSLTGLPTSPFRVFRLLVKDGVDPGYSLAKS